VAITEVIVGNTILTKKYLISPEDLFGLNPKLDIKPAEKRMGPLLLGVTRGMV
jgi:hypothetical protein